MVCVCIKWFVYVVYVCMCVYVCVCLFVCVMITMLSMCVYALSSGARVFLDKFSADMQVCNGLCMCCVCVCVCVCISLVCVMITCWSAPGRSFQRTCRYVMVFGPNIHVLRM
jgi:hypothetical protein